MQGGEVPQAISNVGATTVNVVFFVLSLIYTLQLAFVSANLRSQSRARQAIRHRNNSPDSVRLWTFLGLSLVGPVLLGFLPDIVFDQGSCSKTPTSMTLHVSVRLLVAYLVTIVTLELAWLAQDHKNRAMRWRGLLGINLLFDVISAVVFDMYKEPLDQLPAGLAVKSFFLLCAIATILTGTVVTCGAYSLLNGE